jgi:hypothetical protein
MKLKKKSIKKNIKKQRIKKQSIFKIKWGCQNLRIKSCGNDNLIEDKT